jgi:xanthine dehydrogenase YagR molybdenum-binding subunit
MKFDTPATTNPIDQLKVVGKPTDRIDGPLKTTGTAPYAYERHEGAQRGLRLRRRRRHRQGPHRLDGPERAARARPACSPSSRRECRQARQGQLQHRQAAGRPEIDHYHQAVALVVAETFEQARAAAQLVRIDYTRAKGRFDLAAEKDAAQMPKPNPQRRAANQDGDFPAPSRRRRAARRDLHHARRVARDDGAARLHRGCGRATS